MTSAISVTVEWMPEPPQKNRRKCSKLSKSRMHLIGPVIPVLVPLTPALGHFVTTILFPLSVRSYLGPIL
jgi:hypothetical protein